MVKESKLFNFFALMFFLITGGVISALVKYELTYDFLQYHYYNGYAFLYGRLTTDIAAASIPSFYNPLLDALSYILIQNFYNNLNIYCFIQGLPFGLLIFVFFKTACLFFDFKTTKGKVFTTASMLVAATGFATWFQIGTTTNEIPVSVLVIGAVYLLLKQTDCKKIFFISGFMLGAATGLKLTAAIYCISTGVTLFIFYKSINHPIKSIGLFVLGGFCGFIATNGFWMWMLWQSYESPVFPFWNAIFKSPYFPEINYTDTLHLRGTTIGQTIFLPFYLIAHSINSYVAALADFSDIRLAMVFVIAVIFCLCFLKKDKPILSQRMKLLCIWMSVSYLVWLLIAANLRFLIPVEMYSAIIIMSLLFKMKYQGSLIKEALSYSLAIIITGMLFVTPYLSAPWGKRTSFDILRDKVILPENTLIMTYHMPSAGAMVEILQDNPTAKIINFTKSYDNWTGWNLAEYGKMKELRDEALSTHQNKIAVLVGPTYHILPEADQIENWECQRLPLTKELRRLRIGKVQMCFPPELKEKVKTERKPSFRLFKKGKNENVFSAKPFNE